MIGTLRSDSFSCYDYWNFFFPWGEKKEREGEAKQKKTPKPDRHIEVRRVDKRSLDNISLLG